MIHFLHMFGELPYIFFISLAVYLAFEHWNFPDLTIEGSFIGGMAITAFVFNGGFVIQNGFLILLMVGLIVFTYSIITFVLNWLEMPSLLSGLLTLFIAYYVNYKLNGSEIAVAIYDGNNYKPIDGINNTSEFFWWFGLFASIILSAILILLDNTRIGAKMRLSRNTPSILVSRSANLNSKLMLFFCLLTFNFVACIGGVMKSLSDNFSGIEIFGLITPGLACMFFVKLMKHINSTPKRHITSGLTIMQHPSKLIVWADSLFAVIIFLFIISIALTLIRYFIVYYGIAADTSLINAFTGILIIVLWIFFQADKLWQKIREIT